MRAAEMKDGRSRVKSCGGVSSNEVWVFGCKEKRRLISLRSLAAIPSETRLRRHQGRSSPLLPDLRSETTRRERQDSLEQAETSQDYFLLSPLIVMNFMHEARTCRKIGRC